MRKPWAKGVVVCWFVILYSVSRYMRPEGPWQRWSAFSTYPVSSTTDCHQPKVGSPAHQKALTKGRTEERSKRKRNRPPRKSVAPRKDEGKEYTSKAGRPSLLSFPVHLSAVLPCPPSLEGLGNYPSHQRVPQEGKDRRAARTSSKAA